MNTANTRFQEFLAREVKKYKGIYVPVKAGLMKRACCRKISCKKLHPNPNDEFCLPQIGPNYEIISRYEHDLRIIKNDPQKARFIESSATEPLIIEKIRPDGYMILNGHHRWAAAVRIGVKRLPVRIVNLTLETDIKSMLQNSRHNKRVTMDLDEVVFSTGPDDQTEKALPFPFNRVYRERLRLGIPALFRFFNANGYDIWVYSAKYYSVDYIKEFFKLYHVHVTGIVTGTARKGPKDSIAREKLESQVNNKYPFTVHIDSGMVLWINSLTKDFKEYPLSSSAAGWSSEIMAIVGSVEKHE